MSSQLKKTLVPDEAISIVILLIIIIVAIISL
jgi:hypothetical protein